MGLGHLSRTLAVAKALETQLGLAPHQIGFWSYSLASALIQQAGYRIIPRQTAKQLGIDGNRWEARETEDLQAYLAARRPRRIIIDHATLETAIMESLENTHLSLREDLAAPHFLAQKPTRHPVSDRFLALMPLSHPATCLALPTRDRCAGSPNSPMAAAPSTIRHRTSMLRPSFWAETVHRSPLPRTRFRLGDIRETPGSGEPRRCRTAGLSRVNDRLGTRSRQSPHRAVMDPPPLWRRADCCTD